MQNVLENFRKNFGLRVWTMMKVLEEDKEEGLRGGPLRRLDQRVDDAQWGGDTMRLVSA